MGFKKARKIRNPVQSASPEMEESPAFVLIVIDKKSPRPNALNARPKEYVIIPQQLARCNVRL